MLASQEKGAVDAWHTALTNIEEFRMDDKGYCGAVADIMKFFDQIRRTVVYKVAKQLECRTRC